MSNGYHGGFLYLVHSCCLLILWLLGNSRLQSEFGLTPTLMAAYGSCLMTRMCAHAAFQKHHRAMLAYDLVSEISSVFRENFDQF